MGSSNNDGERKEIMKRNVEYNKFDEKALMDFFIQYCPQAPIRKCADFARKLQAEIVDNYIHKEALAVLSETICGMNDNGKIPKELKEKYENNKAVLWALDTVQYCHAWVVCGPGGGMEEFIERISKEVNET